MRRGLMILTILFYSLNTYAADTTTPATAGAPPKAPATTSATPATNKSEITAADFDNMKKNVESAGFTFTQTGDKLAIVIDQAKLFSMIPTLVKADAIANVTDADLKSVPLTVTVYAAGVTFTVTIMTGVYARDPSLDKLHVTTYVIPVGSTDKKECFSYDYTRADYKNLDLDNTTTSDFLNKTPGFTFSDWCKTTLDAEEKASSPATKSGDNISK